VRPIKILFASVYLVFKFSRVFLAIRCEHYHRQYILQTFRLFFLADNSLTCKQHLSSKTHDYWCYTPLQWLILPQNLSVAGCRNRPSPFSREMISMGLRGEGVYAATISLEFRLKRTERDTSKIKTTSTFPICNLFHLCLWAVPTLSHEILVFFFDFTG
jgi:hypothetical protein